MRTTCQFVLLLDPFEHDLIFLPLCSSVQSPCFHPCIKRVRGAQSKQLMDFRMAKSIVRRLRSHFTVRTRPLALSLQQGVEHIRFR